MSAHRVTIRAAVSVIIIGGFFVAFFMNPADDIFRGAVVAAFSSAYGYWLGSSHGATENRDQLNKITDKIGTP